MKSECIHMTTHAQLHVIGQGEARNKQADRILEKLELGKMATELSKAIIKTSSNADPYCFLSTPFLMAFLRSTA